jgi:seryl-tRNA synthetase
MYYFVTNKYDKIKTNTKKQASRVVKGVVWLTQERKAATASIRGLQRDRALLGAELQKKWTRGCSVW